MLLNRRTLLRLLVGAGIVPGMAWAKQGMDACGSGARTVHVEHLRGAGPGSLRAALALAGPRRIVFDVAGTIDLNGRDLVLREAFACVDGASAPAPGITIIRGGLQIHTHDVVVRHLRIRPGDAGRERNSGFEPDAVNVVGRRVWIDHCSLAWGVDEVASVGGARAARSGQSSREVCFSHCIIAEGLERSSHGEGTHSRGTLIMDGASDIWLVGNLYAHNRRRNPYFKGGTDGVVVNNLIYNPGEAAIHASARGHGEYLGRPRLDVRGNVMVAGPDTRFGLSLLYGPADAFMQDNLIVPRQGQRIGLLGGGAKSVQRAAASPPAWLTPVRIRAAHSVIHRLPRTVGAYPTHRDRTDVRVIRSVSRRSGRIIDSQGDVGGYR